MKTLKQPCPGCLARGTPIPADFGGCYTTDTSIPRAKAPSASSCMSTPCCCCRQWASFGACSCSDSSLRPSLSSLSSVHDSTACNSLAPGELSYPGDLSVMHHTSSCTTPTQNDLTHTLRLGAPLVFPPSEQLLCAQAWPALKHKPINDTPGHDARHTHEIILPRWCSRVLVMWQLFHHHIVLWAMAVWLDALLVQST